MAYDGFYAGLSTRATVNEILNDALEVEANITEMQQQINEQAATIQEAYSEAESVVYLPYQAPTVTGTSSGVSLDLSTNNKYTLFKINLVGNVPISFINQSVPSNRWRTIEIHLVQTTGNDTVSSWPPNVVWNQGDDAPRLSTTVGAVDKITLSSSDNGATWVGQYARVFRTVSTSFPVGVAREGDEWIVVHNEVIHECRSSLPS